MLQRLTEEIGSRPLGLARILIGLAAAIRALVAWRVLRKLSLTEILDAPYFDWYPAPSMTLAVVIVVVWFLSAVLMMVGWQVTLSGSVLLFSIVFTLGLDRQAYSNHLYLMALLVFLLVVADAGAGVNYRRSDRPVVRWPIFLLKAQASIVYAFAAITKINADFFSGKVVAGVIHGGIVGFPDWLRREEVFVAISIATVFVELFLAVFLWSNRFRPAAFVFGILLHVPIVLLMPDTWELIVFTLEMLALYPLFLSQDKLTVYWDDACGACRDWIRRFQRFDVLELLRPVGKGEASDVVEPTEVEQSLHLSHANAVTKGFRAVTGILEHLVPTLWLAPFLRLPGVSALGERWYRWQARRRFCAVGSGS